jgi:hypothetical protein
VWACSSATGAGCVDHALAFTALRPRAQGRQIGRDSVARVTQLPGPNAARWFGVGAGGATHSGRPEPGGSGDSREAAGQGDAQACLLPQSGDLAWDVGPVFVTDPSGSPRSAFLPCPGAAPNDLCDGLIWPKDVFASTAWAQQRRHNFLPLSVRGTVIPRGTRKFLLCCLAPVKPGVRPPSPPASRSPSRSQWSGPETEQTEI